MVDTLYSFRSMMMLSSIPNASWETLPDLPTPRAYSAVISHEGNIYVFGGCNHRGQPLDAVEAFDCATRKWTTLPSMSVKRAGCNAVLNGSHLVVVGGCKEGNQPVTDVEQFDIANRTWSKLVSLPAVFMAPTIAAVKGNLYVFGGMQPTGQCSDACYVLNDGDAEWSLHSHMPTKRYACHAFVFDDEIFVVGGRVQMTPVNATEGLDIHTGQWKSYPPILTDRVFGSVISHDKFVYVLGGLQGTTDFINAAEVFDMEKKSWKNIDPLPSKRADMAAQVVGNYIVLAGGLCEYGPAKTTEVFDIKKGYWHTLPEMPTPRWAGSAVAHGNMCLVIGGLGLTGPCGKLEALSFH